MSKEKINRKLDYKKSIIRNPEKAKPKTVVIHPSITDEFEKCSLSEDAKETRFVKETQKSKLGSPELNSALQITRRIQSVESLKPRKIKSASDLDKKNKLAIDERAAKQVNIPYDKSIYKDLIPLCVTSQSQVLPVASKEIIIHKDREPSLSDFFTPKVLPEYSFAVPIQTRSKTLERKFDGFKLYRIMKTWDES